MTFYPVNLDEVECRSESLEVDRNAIDAITSRAGSLSESSHLPLHKRGHFRPGGSVAPPSARLNKKGPHPAARPELCRRPVTYIGKQTTREAKLSWQKLCSSRVRKNYSSVHGWHLPYKTRDQRNANHDPSPVWAGNSLQTRYSNDCKGNPDTVNLFGRKVMTIVKLITRNLCGWLINGPNGANIVPDKLHLARKLM